ncbi:GNAT family N-acetyltransferase [Candidatus Micrarchaeota archaeon]|nr:GNAT family N-acetyltransferase [Candidatus Micrarchaeota archaeon]
MATITRRFTLPHIETPKHIQHLNLIRDVEEKNGAIKKDPHQDAFEITLPVKEMLLLISRHGLQKTLSKPTPVRKRKTINGKKIKLSKATSSDLDELHELEQLCFDKKNRISKKALKDRLNHSDVFIARDHQGKIIGMVSGRAIKRTTAELSNIMRSTTSDTPRPNWFGNAYYLENIAVHPNWRHAGIATELMNWIENAAIDRKSTSAIGHAISPNEPEKHLFIQKGGYTPHPLHASLGDQTRNKIRLPRQLLIWKPLARGREKAELEDWHTKAREAMQALTTHLNPEHLNNLAYGLAMKYPDKIRRELSRLKTSDKHARAAANLMAEALIDYHGVDALKRKAKFGIIRSRQETGRNRLKQKISNTLYSALRNNNEVKELMKTTEEIPKGRVIG